MMDVTTMRELCDSPGDRGNYLTLADGRALRCTIEPDEHEECLYIPKGQRCGHIDDDEYLGLFAWVDERRWSDYPPPRPPEMDGRAVKLSRRDGDIWWQPGPDLTADDIRELKPKISDLLDFGYSLLRLEVLSTETDGYGRRIVLEYGTAGHIWPHETDLRDHLAYCVEQIEDADDFPPVYLPEEMAA